MTRTAPKPKFGPTRKYRVASNVFGLTAKRIAPYGVISGAFAGVAGFTALYLLEGVPLVQNDVFSKIPILGSYWKGREIPASDNPF